MGSRARWYLIVSAVLAALTLAGCPAKESPEDIEFAAQQAKKAAQEKKKKVDVFDEFYVDDAKKAPPAAESKAKAKGKAEAVPAAAPAVAKQSALPAAGSQGFSKNGRYVVQVSSTASESEANSMVSKLKGLGYPAYAVTVQNPTPTLIGTYFRVRLGGFDNYSEAKAFAEGTLASAGYDYWVDRKANDNVGIQGAGFGSSGGQQQYQPAPAPQPAAKPQQPAPAATAPQPYQPASAPQQYQPAPAPQPAAKPQQPAPAAPAPQQYQPAPAPQQYQPAPTPQPAAKPQQPPPAAAPQPAAKPQQPAPAAPASKPAAQPTQSTNDWGTTDDWGSADW